MHTGNMSKTKLQVQPAGQIGQHSKPLMPSTQLPLQHSVSSLQSNPPERPQVPALGVPLGQQEAGSVQVTGVP